MWNVQNNLWTSLLPDDPARTLLKSSSFPTPGCGGERLGAVGLLGLIHITPYYYDYGYLNYPVIYTDLFRCKEKTYALYL